MENNSKRQKELETDKEIVVRESEERKDKEKDDGNHDQPYP